MAHAIENDSYCAEANVIALVQITSDYTGATVPTEAQVLDFQAGRASEIYAWMTAKVGALAPGPASYSVTIDTATDRGKALNFLTIQANAFGAAADALEAAGAGAQPARTERIAELFESFFAMREAVEMSVEQYVAGASANTAKNAFTEGRVTPATFTSQTEDGFEFDGETVW